MRPEDNQQSGRVGTPQTASRSYTHIPPSRARQQEAAANIVRSQINSIYDSTDQAHAQAVARAQTPAVPQPAPVVQPPAQTPQPVQTTTLTPTTTATQAPEAEPTTTAQQQSGARPYQPELTTSNPYERTHSKRLEIQPEQWKAYHSAWQDYYKRYYEGYYTQQVSSAKHSLQAQAAQAKQTQTAESTNPHSNPESVDHRGDTPSDANARKAAMNELRSKLLKKVEASTQKARKSRHFVPVLAALGVLIIFGFLQYNQVLIANVKAYVTPGSIDPQNIIVDPASTVEVGPEARLIIPKINVDAPVFYDIPITQAAQDKAMEDGVAHFPIAGANSRPGEVGNTVLSGHSSNDVFAAGNFKFIFMQLDKLQIGDTIYANYEGTRYTYVVTEKKEVAPTDVQALIYETDKPEMTLITCTPLGTALRRLLVTAEQVYPETSKPAPAESSNTGSAQNTTMPGQGESTVLERLFGR